MSDAERGGEVEVPRAVVAGGDVEAPPPFWSGWGRIYGFIAALLAAETLAFWLLSRWAS